MSVEPAPLQSLAQLASLWHLRRVTLAYLQQRLTRYFETANWINQINQQALLTGQLDWHNMDCLRQQFFQQMQQFPHLSGIQWGSCEGDYIGVLDLGNRTPTLELKHSSLGQNKLVFALDASGHPTSTRLGWAVSYDPRDRPWYTTARDRPGHSPIYQYASSASIQLGIMVTLAVMDNDQQIGVVGCDLALTHLSDLLAQVSQQLLGTYCILDRQGHLISSSVHPRPFVIEGTQARPMTGLSCGIPMIETALAHLQHQGVELATLQDHQQFQYLIAEQPHFIDVQPLAIAPDLRWVLMVCLSAQEVLPSHYQQSPQLWDVLTTLKQNNDELLAQVQQHAQALQVSNQALKQSEERWSLALQGTNDGLWDWHLETNEVFFSDRWQQISGYVPGELAHHFAEWEQRLHPEDRPHVMSAMQHHLQGRDEYYVMEHRTRCKDGSYKWVLDRGRALWDDQGKPVRMVGSRSDITERKEMESRLIFQAEHDALTGLLNRAALTRRLQACTEADVPDCVLMYINIDRFKAVNDSLGHVIGDRLIVKFAQALRQMVDADGLVARLNGDEFVVLVRRNVSLEALAEITDRIQAALQAIASDLHLCTPVAVSIGITSTVHSVGTPEELLKDADIAMYTAKRNGGNQFVLFSPVLRERSLQFLKLESALKQAVENEELGLYFQPIMSLKKMMPVGLEALVRWHHPEQGMVSPGKFIPLAEQTGLILSIGDWILQRAVQHLRDWHDRCPVLKDLVLNVNVSMQQFYQPSLINSIDRLLSKYQLSPQQIQLEITESCFMENPELAIGNIHALHERQIPLCIDDFGTGYSSLSYLHRLPVASLKIDQTFVSRIVNNDQGIAMVKAILAMSHSLGIKVVAEGIETPEQLQKLQELGCEFGQGYLFSRPCSATDIEAWMSQWMAAKGSSASISGGD